MESTPRGPDAQQRPRVGLVLGGGGILGAAWLIGALHALADEADWDPRTADYIIGTSAGSVVGSLVAAGMPTWFLVYHQRGGDTDGMVDLYGERISSADERSRRLFRLDSVPLPVAGSPLLALRTLAQPWKYPPTAAMAGWMPRGFFSTEEVGRIIRSVVGQGWADHPNLWIVAMDYRTGKRVVFGGGEAPETDLYRAVEASCAIPGFYTPVEIDGRPYVDGGVWSPSNLDLLVRARPDIVFALNPMSSLHPGIPTTILERVERRFRAVVGRRLGREANKLRRLGTELLLVQPRHNDLEAMGWNLMNPSRRELVLETALRTTRDRLQEDDAQEIFDRLRTAARRPSPRR